MTISCKFTDFRQNNSKFMQKNLTFKKYHLRARFVFTISGEEKRLLPIFSNVLGYLNTHTHTQKKKKKKHLHLKNINHKENLYFNN